MLCGECVRYKTDRCDPIKCGPWKTKPALFENIYEQGDRYCPYCRVKLLIKNSKPEREERSFFISRYAYCPICGYQVRRWENTGWEVVKEGCYAAPPG
jgi:hypothetical protein